MSCPTKNGRTITYKYIDIHTLLKHALNESNVEPSSQNDLPIEGLVGLFCILVSYIITDPDSKFYN